MNLAQSVKASDLFVKALENEGVRWVFGVPGEENLDFLESLRKSVIKLIVTRHEQSAGFMAATVGRLTGTAGVALATLGPGATNLTTAAAYAYLGGFPMLMITGQKPILKSKQGAFQIVNTTAIFDPITKFTKQLVHGGLVPSLVREAMRQANEERPGSTHLELPEDVAREEVPEAEAVLYEVSKVRRAVVEEKAINKAVELIKAAKHPLMVLGAGTNRKMTTNMLRQFVDATGIPFCCTMMGKGVVDSRHSSYMGTTSLSDNDYVHAAIRHADLIIIIGHDVVEKPPFFMHASDTDRKVVHVNYFSARVDQVYFPHLELVGDIGNAVWRLLQAIPEAPESWDLRYFRYVQKEMMADIEKESDSDAFPIALPRLIRDVRQAVPETESIVALDNGLYKVWMARDYSCYAPNSLLLDNALASMGAGVPSAMAAKLVKPEANVFAVVGDGGFLMNGAQELLTAVDNNLHITILVLNDNAYGMIKWKQEGMGLQDFGLGLSNPDFGKLAEAYGVQSHTVASADDLSKVLSECVETPNVHLVEVPISYNNTQRDIQEKALKKHLDTTLKSVTQILGDDAVPSGDVARSGKQPVKHDRDAQVGEQDAYALDADTSTGATSSDLAKVDVAKFFNAAAAKKVT